MRVTKKCIKLFPVNIADNIEIIKFPINISEYMPSVLKKFRLNKSFKDVNIAITKIMRKINA